MKQLTFNTEKTHLTEQDVEQLVVLLGKRCSLKTLTRLRSVLTYSASRIPNYGIFDRLMLEIDRRNKETYWTYCAGQSYPDEIRTVRKLILEA